MTVRRSAALAVAAGVIAIGALTLSRPGYTPDEEYTLFAVRGIADGGLPLLPSGLLYDRGLLYSYLGWGATLVSGVELPAFRALSLFTAALSLVLGHRLLATTISPAAGLGAVSLVAASLPFWAAATTGRFYALFVATLVGMLVATRSMTTDARAGRWVALAVWAALSRLTHELAFVVMAVPLVGALLAHRRTFGRWTAVATALAAGLILAQGLLFALHFLNPSPASGAAMIERFFLWQVLNLFERPQGLPLGLVVSMLVAGLVLAPMQVGRLLRVAAVAATITIAVGFAMAWGGGPTSSPGGILAGSLQYPLDMFWYLARHHPLLIAAALALLVARLFGAGGEWPPAERAAHLAWLGWVLWFGVIESGITINYVLLPVVCALAAIGVDLVAIGQHTAAIWPGRRAQLLRAALVAVALLVAVDQWRGPGTMADRLAAARPTIRIEGIERVRDTLAPTDLVGCTDELACLLLVGRVDAWLALDDYVRERFVLTRPDTRPVGVYAGTPAVFRAADLFDGVRQSGPAPSRVLVVDVFKQYPVGDSRTWLPRALAADRLEIQTLIETPRARVVEIR